MKEDPRPGDWCKMVAKDKENTKLHMDDEHIFQTSDNDCNKLVKELERKEAFGKLKKKMQGGHQKVNQIEYSQGDKPQEYLRTNRFSNNECSLLFNLRCKTVQGFKDNFHGLNRDINCDLCGKEDDSQMHALNCHMLELYVPKSPNVAYNHIFGTVNEQKGTVVHFSSLLEGGNMFWPSGALQFRTKLMHCN